MVTGPTASGDARRGLPLRVEGRTHQLVRAGWLLVVLPVVGLVSVGFVRAYADPVLIAIGPLADLFVALGLSFRLMMTVSLLLPFVVSAIIAGVVFWRRSHDPMALVFTLVLFLLYSVTSRTLLTYGDVPVLRHSYGFLLATAMIGLAFVFAVLPDGRYVPRWTRWLAPAMVVVSISFPDAASLFEALFAGEVESFTRLRLMVVSWLAVLTLGLGAQVHRYRRVSTGVERLQTKWVVAPLIGVILISFAVFAVPAAFPASGDAWLGWAVFTMIPVGILTPLAVANAVLRHRLYEIDRIISRTVSYGLIVVVLASVYVAGVLGVGATLSGLLGESGGDLLVAASVLVVAALFRPVRSRIQDLVDRRFNRTGYEARTVTEGLSHRLRDQVDVGAIRGELAGVASGALDPVHAGVWMVPTEGPTSDD